MRQQEATPDNGGDATASPTPRAPKYVVGIGASAGGLEALERFFDRVPADTGMAFVVVQHLSPDFRSLMDELLARHTDLPIRLVEDGMPIEPDHVYLIPPKKEMIVSGGRLLLSERDQKHELSLPIDVFFRSLAQDCGTRAVAIVLSGGGSDGSRGIRHVRERGGLVIVQDAESAQFDGMPKTAIDAGVAHWVLPPEEMPRVLIEHAKRPPAPTAARDGRYLGGSTPRGLAAVYAKLEEEFGLDFTNYKPSTVTRRIERRLQLARTGDIDAYVERLHERREELDTLYRDLLIGVTRFFRNEDAFQVLEERVLPELFAQGPSDVPLRVWVAGCATGEEAYSLAIVLNEASARHKNRPVKIFASDVHRGSLEIAARAVYDEEAVKNVSPERLERYFLRRGRTYQVVPELRQTIVFAPHNVIRDAPFTRVDLVTCRNLLIYLQPAAQQKVLSLFHFALNRGGVVFLGPSESVGPLARDFETVHRYWRIYRKHSDVRIPVDARFRAGRSEPKILPAPLSPTAPRYSLSQLLATYDTLLDEVMPPSLLVSEHGELVHAFAGASRFLRPHDGRQGLDVIDLVDTELRMVLVGGFKRALKERQTIAFKGVRLTSNAGEETHRVTIRAVKSRTGNAPHLLVTFEPMEAAAPRVSRVPSEHEIDLGDVSREQLSALEAELSHTKENLQSAIEELETSNEELQAANEELLASNEELQSTNEELQSVNEELYTVNAEYQRKIAELLELTNDMDNLLSSTDIGTIFLDQDLKIRKFTPRVAQVFSLLPQDVGRSIESFTHNIDHPELVTDLKRVLATAQPVERELRDRGGATYFLRVLPYRAKGTVGGVVLTLIDVSGLKSAEDALFHERYLLDSLLFGVPDAIYFRDARGRFIRANTAMAARLGLGDPREMVGRTPFDVAPHDEALALHDPDDRVLKTGEPQHYELERRARPDGHVEWTVATRLPLRDRSGAIVGVIDVFRDVTKQQQADEQIREAVRRRDQFLAMLSHELRNPLGAIVTATALLKIECGESVKSRRLIQIVDRQSQQMSRLLDDLLEAGRVTQNKIELRRRIVDLGPVVMDAADAVRSLMDAKGLQFTVKTPAEPILIDGDPARLQQVQVNMLSNAAKYTPRGGHVWLEAVEEEGQAVIRVRDDGVGIPKDMLDAVFDLFVQSRRTLDRADGGLGLGLTIVRSLVAMHGGTITAYSEGEGKGSEFVVRLPIAHGVSAELPRPKHRPKLPKGSKVVVVEDNADSREMLCQLLVHVGFECHAAENGVTGLAAIEAVRPAVAIIDVGLPEMDGFELARRVRADPKNASVLLVALTGYGQPADRANAKGAGFDEHIVKPIDADVLVRLLGGGRLGDGDGDGRLVGQTPGGAPSA